MLTMVRIDESCAYRCAILCQARVCCLTCFAEHIINENPYVSACIVFGHGKFQNGVLIQPSPENQFDPKDKQLLRAFRNTIWYAPSKPYYLEMRVLSNISKADG